MANKSLSDGVRESPEMEPAEEVLSPLEIRERAYDLWDRNHRPDGYELEFWLMAERELKAERRSTPSGLPEAKVDLGP